MIAGGQMVSYIMGALAEFERDWTQVGTKVGVPAAENRGERLYRTPVLTEAQVRHAKASMSAMRETVPGVAEWHGVNRSTIQRAIGARQ